MKPTYQLQTLSVVLFLLFVLVSNVSIASPDLVTLQSNSGISAKELLANSKLKAEEGDADSQYLAFEIIFQQFRSEETMPEAIRYLKMAAAQNHIYAKNALGQLMLYGKYLPKDVNQGIGLIESAGSDGHIQAIEFLGAAYELGKIVQQNDSKSAYWYKIASEYGSIDGQYGISKAHYFGKGTIKDNVLAYMWANMAARKGDADAIKVRDNLEHLLSSKELEEARSLSRKCLSQNFKNCGG